jgi:hypothetical protein
MLIKERAARPMTITSSSQDPRSLKAIELAAGAGQWAKAYLPDGTKCVVQSHQHRLLFGHIVAWCVAGYTGRPQSTP